MVILYMVRSFIIYLWERFNEQRTLSYEEETEAIPKFMISNGHPGREGIVAYKIRLGDVIEK